MENASKALIMAAEILFGIIFISLFVLMYFAWSNFSDTINSNIQDTEINKFNSKFYVYNERTDLTAHDVVTVVSLVNEYNLDIDDNSYKIKIEGNGIPSISSVMNNIPDFLNQNNDKKFSLKIISYNDKNKVVEKIKITKN